MQLQDRKMHLLSSLLNSLLNSLVRTRLLRASNR